MIFILLINVKMSTITIVDILTFISRVNTPPESLKSKKSIYFSVFRLLWAFEISCLWVEHEKSCQIKFKGCSFNSLWDVLLTKQIWQTSRCNYQKLYALSSVIICTSTQENLNWGFWHSKTQTSLLKYRDYLEYQNVASSQFCLIWFFTSHQQSFFI